MLGHTGPDPEESQLFSFTAALHSCRAAFLFNGFTLSASPGPVSFSSPFSGQRQGGPVWKCTGINARGVREQQGKTEKDVGPGPEEAGF